MPYKETIKHQILLTNQQKLGHKYHIKKINKLKGYNTDYLAVRIYLINLKIKKY